MSNKIKIGDTISAQLFGGKRVTGTIESIEICRDGDKYGKMVSTCDLSRHSNGVVELDCGNWCYFNQIEKKLTNGKD